MTEIYLWRVRLTSYDGDGYDADWFEVADEHAAVYDWEDRHEMTIVSVEVEDRD